MNDEGARSGASRLHVKFDDGALFRAEGCNAGRDADESQAQACDEVSMIESPDVAKTQ